MNKNNTMINTNQNGPSSYIQYLPGIYQANAEKGGFVGRYIRIFEKILSGNDDVNISNAKVEGIEHVIDRIYEFFDPDITPSEPSQFLKWLAGWVALTLRDDWEDIQKRRLLKRIVPLYKKRGTKGGLSEYLAIFVGPEVRIDEFWGIIVGKTATTGFDTLVGGLPHFFIVTITFLKIKSPGFIQNTIDATKSILDLEKPAHTFYRLRFMFPGMIISEENDARAIFVGKNTIIGSTSPILV